MLKKAELVTVCENVKQRGKLALLTATTVGMTLLTAVPAFAAETTTGLPAEVKTAIEAGFTGLNTIAQEVIVISVVSVCGIITLSAGANFAMKKIKGALSKAS